MRPICRIGRLVSTPVTLPFTKYRVVFGSKRRVLPTRYSRLFLSDWLSSGRVTLNDPSIRAFFRNPGDLWLADRFRRDSFLLASTLSEQLFHYQCFSGSYARSHQPLGGEVEPYQQTTSFVASDSVKR